MKSDKRTLAFNPREMKRTGYIRLRTQGPPCPCCGHPLPDVDVGYEEARAKVLVELLWAIEHDLNARAITDLGLFKISFTITRQGATLIDYRVEALVSETLKDGIPLAEALAFAKDVFRQWNAGDTASYIPFTKGYFTE